MRWEVKSFLIPCYLLEIEEKSLYNYQKVFCN